MATHISWGDPSLLLDIEFSADFGPSLRRLSSTNGFGAQFEENLPLVEILAVSHAHALANDRLVQTTLGASLRYESHSVEASLGWSSLTISMVAPDDGVAVDLTLRSPAGVAALQSIVTVRNLNPTRNLTLQSVTSWVSSFGASDGAPTQPAFDDWRLLSGRSDWLAEGRWREEPLRDYAFPSLAQQLTGHNPRGARSFVSTGTWSTGKNLPVAAVSSARQGLAWAWQLEHNGAWRWEVGENTVDGYFALSGPTEIDHSWIASLETGESFTTVPVAVSVAPDVTTAVSELTRYRRASRRVHPDNSSLGVVFNDYMNTLGGDPTTDKLLPLIDAAAEVGSEIFCIDAGWYDDSGNWWDSVGEWHPSTTRFPRGLGEVIARIRERGMIPGLWLEPEVVGVRSPMAEVLPNEAFLLRRGRRVVEHDRYHLDLRHPAAVSHLNEVVDRLISEFGIGFLKLDYNINPGAGTDEAADSVGAGLLGHNRAHLAWLDSLLDRHPSLIIENCASGAMRMDFAILSRLQLQSTSDQQDALNYPPIAAAAPLSMLPEQAASWAYPQPEMDDEEIALSLCTSMLGRFYLSGYLNNMTESQRGLVGEAVTAHKGIRHEIARSVPFWPLGLPDWSAPWVALGLRTETSRFVTIWNRSTEGQGVALHFPDLVGVDVTVHTVFPQRLPQWQAHWDSGGGTLHVLRPTSGVGARTIELRMAA